MEILKEIAHISGKGGLYRIVKPSRSGVIVETIDATRARTVVNANSRVSVLQEISVYTDTKEGAVPLAEVLMTIHAQRAGQPLDLDPKTASEPELERFLEAVLPTYDRARVYASDIRKMINWYNSLVRHLPEAFVTKESEASETPVEPTEAETAVVETTEVKTTEMEKAD